MPHSRNLSPVTKTETATGEALPGGYGPPLASATIRQRADDFLVDEQLIVDFSRVGEHLWLRIEKRHRDTADVVRHLSRALSVHPASIGYAGLKDRHALTRQWFSAPSPLPAERSALATRIESVDGIVLLEAVRHQRKLRRGTHTGNRFSLTVRDLASLAPVDSSLPLCAALDKRLEAIGRQGFPNYAGPQRFGREQHNLQAVRRLAATGGRLPASRFKRGLYLSTARSALFNHVCAARVKAGTWLMPLDGEPLLLAGSQSFFIGDAGAEVLRRIALGDLHTSGPLPGRGGSAAERACGRFEQALLAGESSLIALLAQAGVNAARRALRALPGALRWRWHDARTLSIDVELEKGVFATSLLAQLIDTDTHAE